VFFHGLGDSPSPFAKLGTQFALPQTAILALRAPCELPLELGNGWFDVVDIAKSDFIKPQLGETRRVRSLLECFGDLDAALEVLLMCGWIHKEIFLFGFSQGGTAAMEWALHREHELFGGIVAVAAGLMEERQWPELWPPKKKSECKAIGTSSKTGEKAPGDCLILAGRRDTTVPPSWANKSAALFSGTAHCVGGTTLDSKRFSAEVVFFDKAHGMLGSPQEAKAVMTFLAPRLVRISAWEQDPDVYLVGASGARDASVECMHDWCLVEERL
jgi:predicted esterase